MKTSFKVLLFGTTLALASNSTVVAARHLQEAILCGALAVASGKWAVETHAIYTNQEKVVRELASNGIQESGEVQNARKKIIADNKDAARRCGFVCCIATILAAASLRNR